MLISVFLTQNLYSFVYFYDLFGVRLNELAVVTYHHNGCLVVDIAYGVVHERLKIVVNEIVGFVENKQFRSRHHSSGKEHTLELTSAKCFDWAMCHRGDTYCLHYLVGSGALFFCVAAKEATGRVHARSHHISN